MADVNREGPRRGFRDRAGTDRAHAGRRVFHELDDAFWEQLLTRLQIQKVIPVVGPGSITFGRTPETLLQIPAPGYDRRISDPWKTRNPAGFVAGYGIKCYLISQDINQLKSRETGYGPDETITSNCHIQTAFPPNRLDTAGQPFPSGSTINVARFCMSPVSWSVPIRISSSGLNATEWSSLLARIARCGCLPSVPRQHFAAGLARVNTDRCEICRSARLVLI
jgi:type IV secretory system conjugative DNA transfer VirD4/TraG family protein